MSLTSLGKKVHICTFIPRTPSRAKYESNVSPLVIKESELSMTGMPASQLREAFNNTQADILIDLTREEDMVMHYLQLRHPAPFKVGNKSSIRDMFDLTVTKKTEDDLPTSFGHMLGFLQTIRTNERPLKD
jgi:hypothetical protein